MLASTAGSVLVPDMWDATERSGSFGRFVVPGAIRAATPRARGGNVAAGRSERTLRIEGWSGAPLASRLPTIALVAAVGFGAVVRPAAPFVFVVVPPARPVLLRGSPRLVLFHALARGAAGRSRRDAPSGRDPRLAGDPAAG